MSGEREDRKINITCQDNSLLKGLISIGRGEALLDFLNNIKEEFIAVKNAEFYSVREIKSFRLIDEAIAKRDNVIVLNKSSIKLAEEIK